MTNIEEGKFFGNLLPSSPDFEPIIEKIREKYGLAEVSPEGEVIEEIYLEDRIVPLEEFRQDIKNHLRKDLSFLPEKIIKQYNGAKLLSQSDQLPEEINILPDEHKQAMEAMFVFIQRIAKPVFQSLENLIDQVANMIYEYLLNGEMGEVPLDWSRVVTTLANYEGKIVLVMANQLAEPEEVIRKFRNEYRKAFGINRPKITIKVANTGYYLQLQKRGISWKRIVEEYIRLEEIVITTNTSSKKYRDTYRTCEQALRKRIQRSKKILEIILEDKK